MKDRPNVIVIMLDTLRADMLKTYGGKRMLPTIDGLAKKGAVYKNAIAPGTYTVPSHVSLFLGKRVKSIKRLQKDPIRHYDENVDPFLSRTRFIDKKEMTLARHMEYLGYKTALFSNNPFVSATTGMAEGFSSIENLWIDEKINKNRNSVKLTLGVVGNRRLRNNLIRLACGITRAIPESRLDPLYYRLRSKLNRHFSDEYGFYDLDKGASKTNAAVDKYLARSGQKNNFLFINYMEAHEGYPTNLITKEYVEQDKWMYMSGISDPSDRIEIIKDACGKRVDYLDKKLAGLLKVLKKRGALDDAVVVFTADHGQGFMEHGQMYHNLFPYNELVHVPLISARFVGGKQIDTSESIDNFVSMTGLHNAILDIGYGKTDMVDGNLRRDNFVFSDHVGITEVWDMYLLRLLRARSKHVDAIYRSKVRSNRFSTAVYHKNYKLIHYEGRGMKDELYDISQDAGETENIIGRNRSVASEMLAADRKFAN